MTTLIYWFRQDLRLADNPALRAACRQATLLIPVYCHDPALDQLTRWNVARSGPHRAHFLAAALADLHTQLLLSGSGLLELCGAPHEVLPELARRLGVSAIFCEAIAAPEEEAAVTALRAAGLTVTTQWQSGLYELADLPFTQDNLPDVFTPFRLALERDGVLPPPPLDAPRHIPERPVGLPPSVRPRLPAVTDDVRSSFPYFCAPFNGGATAAQAHIKQYFSGALAHSYKATRNGLSGTGYSSKFSPWLASGAVSARTIYAALKAFEARQGASDSSYWLWFELLWREYFRLLHLKYGRRLYQAQGLTQLPAPPHDTAAFARWCQGATGESLVDAGMRELAASGYLSNRLRQVAASYLIHDLACDWRAGAAWFESQLIDYDVYSNQGNWLYLAGRGTDPRNGRRFNPQKQTKDHDPDGVYRRLWGALT